MFLPLQINVKSSRLHAQRAWWTSAELSVSKDAQTVLSRPKDHGSALMSFHATDLAQESSAGESKSVD